MNRQMIVFGEDWGAHPSSTQHLIRQIQQQYEIFWVNSIGLRRPRLNMHDLQRGARKLWQMVQRPQPAISTTNSPRLVAPRALPLPGSQLARQLNGYLLQNCLQPLLNRQQRPLLWTSLPSAVDVVGRLNEQAVIYYCGDDFSSLDGVDHKQISAMETELAQRADLILAASPAIAQRFDADKTRLLSHGVDYELFSTPAARPADLQQTCGPVVGFYGSLANWLDQSLLVAAARALPGWTFMLIGEARTDITALQAEPNIVLMGPRPHHQLPGYIQHWDVALLPFCDNNQIQACNPLKLREYMAAGTPIVSTRFPALNGYTDLLRIGHTQQSFINALRHARAEGNRYRERRQQRVANESWQAKGNELHALLQNL
ncbi:MAG: glycosyltransferase [Marinobacterium sp.]|nr:glycosyltransferase [Marinobacterium sp.]